MIRRWILGLLMGSGLLLPLGVFCGGVGAVLYHLGDETGARAAIGAAGVLAAGFAVVHILLVTLLALAFLEENMEGAPLADRPPHP